MTANRTDAERATRAWMADMRANQGAEAAARRYENVTARFGDDRTSSEAADIDRLADL